MANTETRETFHHHHHFLSEFEGLPTSAGESEAQITFCYLNMFWMRQTIHCRFTQLCHFFFLSLFLPSFSGFSYPSLLKGFILRQHKWHFLHFEHVSQPFPFFNFIDFVDSCPQVNLCIYYSLYREAYALHF